MGFTTTELEYLASQHLGRMATMRPDGTLQVSPVMFRYNPVLGTIDVAGYNLSTSRKFKNIAANGKVAFVVDDLATVSPWRPRCVEVRGHAEALADAEGGAVIRIHPERIISFGLDEQDTPAHSLTINSRDVGAD